MLIESEFYQPNSETRSQKLSHLPFDNIRYFRGLTEHLKVNSVNISLHHLHQKERSLPHHL
jgi:hypothetical protein